MTAAQATVIPFARFHNRLKGYEERRPRELNCDELVETSMGKVIVWVRTRLLTSSRVYQALGPDTLAGQSYHVDLPSVSAYRCGSPNCYE